MRANKLSNAVFVSLLGLSLASASAMAEKINCSYSKTLKQNISNQAIEPGDRPDRRMTQFVRVDVLSSRQPEWDGAEQTVYGHSDTVGGAGTNTGYSVTIRGGGHYRGVTTPTGLTQDSICEAEY